VLGGEVEERGEGTPVLVELRDRLGVLGVEDVGRLVDLMGADI
jgi:hypothetical protein